MRTKPPIADNKGLPPKSGQRGPAAAINNENIYNNLFTNHNNNINNQQENININSNSNRVTSQERGTLKEIINHQPTTVGQLIVDKRPSIAHVASYNKENLGGYANNPRYPSSEDKHSSNNLYSKPTTVLTQQLQQTQMRKFTDQHLSAATTNTTNKLNQTQVTAHTATTASSLLAQQANTNNSLIVTPASLDNY